MVVFDGDDTLWQTQHLYDDAKAVLYRILEARGLDASIAAKRLEAIDLQNLSTLSYSPQRFPRSLVMCYLEMLAGYSLPPRASEQRALERAGKAVFSHSAKVSRSAATVLRSLRPRYRLALLTKGDRNIQGKRLRESNLGRFLDSVSIVPEKTEEIFACLLAKARCEPVRAWSIGNSVRSDINPALSLGMGAIWLQTRTWAYELDEPQQSARLFVIHQLRDVLGLLQ